MMSFRLSKSYFGCKISSIFMQKMVIEKIVSETIANKKARRVEE